MTVGDGWNDALMMQTSDISFEFQADTDQSSTRDFTFSSDTRAPNIFSNQVLSNNFTSSKDSPSELFKQKPLKYSTVEEQNQQSSPGFPLSAPQRQISIQTIFQPKQSSRASRDELQKRITYTARSQPNAGDIIISDLSIIQRLMKFYSPRLMGQAQWVIFESFYFYFLLFIFNFSANFETQSSSVQLFNSDFVFLSIFIHLPRTIIYIIFYDPFKFSHHFPLVMLFDKMYHNNKEQRNKLRVSSVASNCLIESIGHFIGIAIPTYASSLNDSAEVLRHVIVIQILIVTRIKMFLNQKVDFKYPNLIYVASIFYEVLAVLVYFGIFLRFSKKNNRSDFSNALAEGDAIMVILFNIIICCMFSAFYRTFRISMNEQFVGKLLTKADELLSRNASIEADKTESKPLKAQGNESVPQYGVQKRHTLNNIDWNGEQRSVHSEKENERQSRMERRITISIQAQVLLEQFLESSFSNLKKPYVLIKRIFKKVKIDKHIEQIMNPAELALNMELGFNARTLEFLDEGLERIYATQMSKIHLKILRFNMSLVALPSLFLCIVSYSVNEPLRGEQTYSSNVNEFRMTSFVLCIIYLLASFMFFREKFLPQMKKIFTVYIVSAICYEAYSSWQNLIDWTAISPFISYLIVLFPFSFVPSVVLSIINLAHQYFWFCVHVKSEIVKEVLKDDDQNLETNMEIYLFFSYLLIVIACLFSSLSEKYSDDRQSKNDFLLKISYLEEKAQRQGILGLLLPEFIREDVILGKSNFSRDQEEASVIFCDVSEFDKIMDKEDYKIVSLLDNLFREFDELTASYGLQKIETVGKTYMAAGGLKAVERNLSKKITRTHHYIRMLIVAHKMHSVAAKSQWGDAQPVKLKVGVHIGPITAGVIGFHKPQFSLIGDTVNTTSRLCANCDAGRSLFSDIIFEKIRPYLETNPTEMDWAYDEFKFEAKGKGTLTAYYIFDLNDAEAQKSASQSIVNTAVPQPRRAPKKRMKTKIYELKSRFSDNEFDQIEDSQRLPSQQGSVSVDSKHESEIPQTQPQKHSSNLNTPQAIGSSENSNPGFTSKAGNEIYDSSNHKGGKRASALSSIGSGNNPPVPLVKKNSDDARSAESFIVTQNQEPVRGTPNSAQHLNNINNNNNNVSQIGASVANSRESSFVIHNNNSQISNRSQSNQVLNSLKNKPTEEQPTFAIVAQTLQAFDQTVKPRASFTSLAPPRYMVNRHSLVQHDIAAQIQENAIPPRKTFSMIFGKPMNQLTDQKSMNSIIFNEPIQHNFASPTSSIPSPAPITAPLTGMAVSTRIDPMRKTNRLQTIDPNRVLRRQNSSVFQNIMERSVAIGSNNDYNPNMLKSTQLGDGIEEDESNDERGNSSDETVETIKCNSFLQPTKESTELFKDFCLQSYIRTRRGFIGTLGMIILFNSIMMLLRNLIFSSSMNWILYSGDIVSSLIFISIIYFYQRLIQTNYLRICTQIAFILCFISICGESFFSKPGVFRVIDLLHLQILIILFIVNKCSSFVEALTTSFIFSAVILTFDYYKQDSNISDALLFIVPLIGFLNHKRIGFIRDVESYNNNLSYHHSKKQEVSLLVHLLPAHIYYTFLRNPEDNSIFTEKFTQTTLLFADISGFTAYSADRKPEQVVQMLKNLFIKFDHKCIKHNVFKLYTIGDCYIVMGFSDANKRDPPTEAKNVVEMGFSMIESLRAFRKEQKDPSDQIGDIEMRIGIHIGDIIGGVIGKNVVRYDIYGKDVLLANKMESNGERGRILISDPLKQLLHSNFPEKYEYKTGPEVQVKSINIKMKSHFVAQKTTD